MPWWVYLSERLGRATELTPIARTGLDAQRFKSISLDVPEREFKTLQSQISDEQRFADAEPFRIRCKACGAESAFDGISDNKVSY